MIRLKRLNDTEIVVNADQIKYVESTPDTIITLMNNEKILVSDGVDELIQKVMEYKRISYPVVLKQDETSSSDQDPGQQEADENGGVEKVDVSS
jgi:flagellar protein FlbD